MQGTIRNLLLISEDGGCGHNDLDSIDLRLALTGLIAAKLHKVSWTHIKLIFWQPVLGMNGESENARSLV